MERQRYCRIPSGYHSPLLCQSAPSLLSSDEIPEERHSLGHLEKQALIGDLLIVAL